MKKLLLGIGFLLVACSAPPAGPADSDSGQPADAGADVSTLDASLPDAFVPKACVRSDVTLARDVLPVLQGCGGSELCHGFAFGSAQTARAFLLQPASECADGRPIVTPSDPLKSYLLDKLTARDLCDGVPMPRSFDGPWRQLPAADIQTIYDWVCAGARD